MTTNQKVWRMKMDKLSWFMVGVLIGGLIGISVMIILSNLFVV